MKAGWYWVFRPLPYMGNMLVFDVAEWDGQRWLDKSSEPIEVIRAL